MSGSWRRRAGSVTGARDFWEGQQATWPPVATEHETRVRVRKGRRAQELENARKKRGGDDSEALGIWMSRRLYFLVLSALGSKGGQSEHGRHPLVERPHAAGPGRRQLVCLGRVLES